MSVAAILADIEATLVQTAEARLAGRLLPAIAEAAVQGCMLQLPLPEAPMHVHVLTALLKWKDSALIAPELHQMLHDNVVAASRPKAAVAANSADVKPKIFAEPPPPPALPWIALSFGGIKDNGISLDYTIGGLTSTEIEAAAIAAKAEQAEAERAAEERRRQRDAEAHVRQYRRERAEAAEAEAGAVDGRRGSRVRQQYPPKKKLKILEVFDAIRDDRSISNKVVAFEAHPGAQGAPYTTVLAWAPPRVRAKLSAHVGKEHRAGLLRIDKAPRAVGRYALMEKELKLRFLARRAKGRKVSPRWLSAMARIIMGELYSSEEAAKFKASRQWRTHFARRASITIRKKTNCKAATWEDTKPVLQRYFCALRRRLQQGVPVDEVSGDPADEASGDQTTVEPEPEDINPEEEGGGEEEEERNHAIDEDDDEEESEERLYSFKLPEGFKVAEAPPAEQLVFRSAEGAKLVERRILYNWDAVGWCEGVIKQTNSDGRKTVAGEKVNFFVYYIVDDDISKHSLNLEGYGADDRWVLLDPA